VLAVFVGTALAGAVPAALAAQQTAANAALNDVLQVVLTRPGLPAPQAATLIDDLRAYPGTSLLPVYAIPPSTSDVAPVGAPADPASFGPPTMVVDCANVTAFPVLGHCAAGVQRVETNVLLLLTDNVATVNKRLPVVTPASRPDSHPASALYLSAVMVKVADPATLERIRTFLATAYPGQTGGFGTAPQTFGEVASVRAAIYLALQNAVLLVVVLTLIAAAASLAIAVTGSVVERKRPFTLLRVSGTTTPTLYRVVLLESLVPLLIATLAAAATGLAVALPIGWILGVHSLFTALPGPTYYLTLTGGLLVSVGVLVATMPIIRRVTVPAGVRFE
jgi:hypothetical protein